MAEPIIEQVRPQPGPQTRFLSCPADIVIYGGSAGGGKSWGLLLEPLRWCENPEFGAVIFRRDRPQITNEGGLWDESHKLYADIEGAVPKVGDLTWRFPAGSSLQFAGIQDERSLKKWQGSQIALIGFDELTHFTRLQFFYMLSRNRSMCGVKPYVRATCNPDADSWVASFIAWWINQDTGLPIPEHDGVVRWFIVINDRVIWADTKDELIETYGHPELPADDKKQPRPKSCTFIAASVFDNKKLLEADPDYVANLMALPKVEQERLLGGNWKIRPSAKLLFDRAWIRGVDYVEPAILTDVVRYWDIAGTPKTPMNDPDWTVGVKLGKDALGNYWILDVVRFRETPATVKARLLQTAIGDGLGCRVAWPQDPGAAGKFAAQEFTTLLEGFHTSFAPEGSGAGAPSSPAKVRRFNPFSAVAQAGRVYYQRAHWNDEFFGQLEGFPDLSHDDDADAIAGAYRNLNPAGTTLAFGSV